MRYVTLILMYVRGVGLQGSTPNLTKNARMVRYQTASITLLLVSVRFAMKVTGSKEASASPVLYLTAESAI